ncbi:hypothetical protein T01_6402 [Trichinella spiralis]|uniref:Uncharacterized protein n=1 Tax=Trichinella spiralis TaxID=6334 RepID=A0A0V1B5X0_TRISP|nr:hypothetical protein T01_6402 [Trichinella spiralis]
MKNYQFTSELDTRLEAVAFGVMLSQLRAQFLGAAGLGDKTMDVSKWMSRLNYPGPALEPHEMEIIEHEKQLHPFLEFLFHHVHSLQVQNMKYLQTSSCLKDAKKEADCLDDIGQKMEKAKFATASMDCHLTLAMDLYENIFEKANEIDQLLEPVPNALQLSNDWENYFPRLCESFHQTVELCVVAEQENNLLKRIMEFDPENHFDNEIKGMWHEISVKKFDEVFNLIIGTDLPICGFLNCPFEKYYTAEVCDFITAEISRRCATAGSSNASVSSIGVWIDEKLKHRYLAFVSNFLQRSAVEHSKAGNALACYFGSVKNLLEENIKQNLENINNLLSNCKTLHNLINDVEKKLSEPVTLDTTIRKIIEFSFNKMLDETQSYEKALTYAVERCKAATDEMKQKIAKCEETVESLKNTTFLENL